MNKVKRLWAMGVSLALCVAAFALNGFSQTSVTVNVTGATNVVHKELYGVLMERMDAQWPRIFVGTSSTTPNTNGMRNDIIDGFTECGVGAAEWPGGCAAVSGGWTFSNSTKNPANDVGVDRFIQFCKLTGAEPVIVGPGVSSAAATNLSLCQYIIDSLKYPLKYFKVGNEVWGCGGNQSESTYEGNYTAVYNQLKNLTGLSIIACNQIEGTGVTSWEQSLLSHLASSINGLEYHDYLYFPNNISSKTPSTADYWEIIWQATNGHIKPHLEQQVFPPMDQYDPNKKIKLCLDEWGDWLQAISDGALQQISLMDGISSGAQLNMFMSHADRILIGGLAQAVCVIHSLMNINASGVMVKTPTFYVFKMFKPHHTNGAKWAPITLTNVPSVTQSTSFDGSQSIQLLTVGATVDTLDTVNLSFTNSDLTATRQVTVNLTSGKPSYMVASAQVITGPTYSSANVFSAAEQVNIQTLDAASCTINAKTMTVTLPAKSIVMVRLAPGTTAIQPANLQKNGADEFSVTAGPQGTLLISSSVSQKTPVTIGLYSVDGKTLIDQVSRTFTAGKNTCTLGSRNTGNGVYIVKITGRGMDLTKQVVFGR